MVGLGQVGEGVDRPVELALAVADLVGSAVGLGEGVDGAEVEVARDVLEVSPVLEPRAGHRDVVGGELALGLDQHGQVLEVVAIPGRERGEELEPVRLRVDGDLDARAVVGRGQEGVLSRIEPGLGQLDADRHAQSHLLAGVVFEGAVDRVEVDRAGQGESHHRLG